MSTPDTTELRPLKMRSCRERSYNDVRFFRRLTCYE
jgi:hypothetical protein